MRLQQLYLNSNDGDKRCLYLHIVLNLSWDTRRDLFLELIEIGQVSVFMKGKKQLYTMMC